MRNTLTILFILLAAISTAALFSCSGGSTPEKDSPAWPTSSLAKAEGVVVEYPGGQYSLIPKEGEWFVASSQSAAGEEEKTPLLRAEGARIEALLDFIAHNRPKQRLRDVSPGFRNETGLDNARIRLTISGTPDWTLELGRDDPGKEGVYARVPGEDGMLLLDSRYRDQLARAPDYYYDLKLVTLAEEEITRMRLEGADNWELRRGEEGYAFTWPEDIRSRAVAASAMDLYLHALAGMKAVSLLAGSPREIPPSPEWVSDLRLTLWGQNQDHPETIELFGKKGKSADMVGRSSRQTTYFRLDKERVEKLAVSSFSLRQRNVLTMDLGDVMGQRLSQEAPEGTPARELVAIKTDRGWENQVGGTQLPGMDMLLWRLKELQYEADPRPRTPGNAERVLTWKLFQDKEEPQAVLTFYLDPALPKDQCWIEVEGKKMSYPVLDQLLEDLQGRLPAGAAEAGGS